MEATLEQLRTVGYRGLSIEETAARSRVDRSMIARRWSTKALLAAEALAGQVEFRPIPATGNLRTDVRRVVQRAIQVLARSPFGRVLVEMVSELDADPEARAQILQMFGPARAAHLDVLQAAAGNGRLPYDIDLMLLLDIISGTVLYRRLLGREPTPHIVDQLTDFIVDLRLPRANPAQEPTT
jgi:AcrR family transcriptional regulator